MKKLLIFGLPLILLAFGLVLGCSSDSGNDDQKVSGDWEPWVALGNDGASTMKVTITTTRPRIVLTPTTNDRYTIEKDGTEVSAGYIETKANSAITFHQTVPEPPISFNGLLTADILSFTDGPYAGFKQTSGIGAGDVSGDRNNPGIIRYEVITAQSPSDDPADGNGKQSDYMLFSFYDSNNKPAPVYNLKLGDITIKDGTTSIKLGDSIGASDPACTTWHVDLATPYNYPGLFPGGNADPAAPKTGRVWVSIKYQGKEGKVDPAEKPLGIYSTTAINGRWSTGAGAFRLGTATLPATAGSVCQDNTTVITITFNAALTPVLKASEIKVMPDTEGLIEVTGVTDLGAGTAYAVNVVTRRAGRVGLYIDRGKNSAGEPIMDADPGVVYFANVFTNKKMSVKVERLNGIANRETTSGLLFTFGNATGKPEDYAYNGDLSRLLAANAVNSNVAAADPTDPSDLLEFYTDSTKGTSGGLDDPGKAFENLSGEQLLLNGAAKVPDSAWDLLGGDYPAIGSIPAGPFSTGPTAKDTWTFADGSKLKLGLNQAIILLDTVPLVSDPITAGTVGIKFIDPSSDGRWYDDTPRIATTTRIAPAKIIKITALKAGTPPAWSTDGPTDSLLIEFDRPVDLDNAVTGFTVGAGGQIAIIPNTADSDFATNAPALKNELNAALTTVVDFPRTRYYITGFTQAAATVTDLSTVNVGFTITGYEEEIAPGPYTVTVKNK
ncbi:MAG: hypothetical protein LBH43_20985 [Treponema sp.]|jgi:hypothetical protein|nr:hypothetical protein [Treponema sp.]